MNYKNANIMKLGEHLKNCENRESQCSFYSNERAEEMTIDDVDMNIQ